jgi:hypothetical protein
MIHILKIKKMILLSFDVGIKNLAYCLLSINEVENTNEKNSKHFIEIVKWNIIDLSCDDVEEATTKNLNAKKCCFKCKKMATYCTHSNVMLSEDVKMFCKKHAEEAQLPMHPKLIKSNSKSGQTPYIVPLSIINKKVSCNKINIVDLGKNIKCHLDVIFAEHMDKIDAILIENQIGNLAGRMNVLQGMISQYFIMRNITNIEFISATNKLKLFKSIINKKTHTCGVSGLSVVNEGISKEGNLDNVLESEKKLYKMRKDAGKMVCGSLLSFYPKLNEWVATYDKHKKRDDLADCFLQGYYYAHLHFNEINKFAFELDAFLSSHIT